MLKRWESDGWVKRAVGLDWIGFGMELPTLLHLLHLLGPTKRDWLQQKSGSRYPRYLLLIPAEAVGLEREVAAGKQNQASYTAISPWEVTATVLAVSTADPWVVDCP